MALVEAVRYQVRAEVPGDFVECGVWRGGSSMAMALTILDRGVDDRDLFLYDTFTHMPFAGEEDVDLNGVAAHAVYGAASADEAFADLPIETDRASGGERGWKYG